MGAILVIWLPPMAVLSTATAFSWKIPRFLAVVRRALRMFRNLPEAQMTEADTLPDLDEDHGPFGRPLFDDPSARALSRVGVVDVGSNSVRMVVFDGAARSPAYFYNEKIMCGLGKGLAQTGRLSPEGRARALMALKRFSLLAQGMGIETLTVVATAAVREAEDGPEFQLQVLNETGLKMWVIDGGEEARLVGIDMAARSRDHLRYRQVQVRLDDSSHAGKSPGPSSPGPA